MIRHLFPDCVTSRVESKAQDDKGVDLCNTGNLQIQCKNMSTPLKYEEVLDKMPSSDSLINVIFFKKTKKVNTTFREIGQFAILKLEDFVKLLEKESNETRLKEVESKLEIAELKIKKLKSIANNYKEDSLLLNALEDCGVNNWDGYDDAIELRNQWTTQENEDIY
jgi:hypothetical protein